MATSTTFNRSEIAKKAWTLVKTQSLSFSEAMKQAWVEAKLVTPKKTRLDILKASLVKKEAELQRRFNQHFATVKLANGQPLNDKRNGQATLDLWERQNQGIRNLQKSIEATKWAIEKEEDKIWLVETTNEDIPSEILLLVKKGVLTQWRKYPNTFFVVGVEKARIIFEKKTKRVAHKYYNDIPTAEQKKAFASVYNSLFNALKQ